MTSFNALKNVGPAQDVVTDLGNGFKMYQQSGNQNLIHIMKVAENGAKYIFQFTPDESGKFVLAGSAAKSTEEVDQKIGDPMSAANALPVMQALKAAVASHPKAGTPVVKIDPSSIDPSMDAMKAEAAKAQTAPTTHLKSPQGPSGGPSNKP